MSDQNWNPNQPQNPANDPYSAGASQPSPNQVPGYGQQPAQDPNQIPGYGQQPYGDPNQGYAPTGQPAYDPYAQAQSAASASDPYAGYPPQGDPYAQVPQDPYSQQQQFAPQYTTGFNSAGVQEGGVSFFQGLFDFSFTKYITPLVVKVIYMLFIVVAAIGWIGMVLVGFTTDAGAGLAALLLGPIFLILYIALVRVGLETSVALIRVAESAASIDKKVEEPKQ